MTGFKPNRPHALVMIALDAIKKIANTQKAPPA
ncbi:hypothetical protein AVKW3434_14530 [Acidovorax sp. SUPP3434]|nr:hypothetical protein AVKW3434_14530 [Acidovorax sp. SUPP3434]